MLYFAAVVAGNLGDLLRGSVLCCEPFLKKMEFRLICPKQLECAVLSHHASNTTLACVFFPAIVSHCGRSRGSRERREMENFPNPVCSLNTGLLGRHEG